MNQQQFHGAVEQVAAGDIKNFIEAPKPDKEPLVKAQRKRLNALVAEIAAECSVAGPALWLQVLHPQLGVDSINDITRDQFQDALDALDAYRQDHRDRVARRGLIGRISNAVLRKGIAAELDRFCVREFGQQDLNSLDRGQLQKALAFADDHASAVPPVQVQSPTARLTIQQLVLSYPVHAGGIAVLGFIMGKIF